MATKRSGYSAGAKKLLLKADKYLSKEDGKRNTMLFDNRTRNAEKAGIDTALRFTREPMEYLTLERNISKVKKEIKQGNKVPTSRNRPKASQGSSGTQSGKSTKRKSK